MKGYGVKKKLSSGEMLLACNKECKAYLSGFYGLPLCIPKIVFGVAWIYVIAQRTGGFRLTLNIP